VTCTQQTVYLCEEVIEHFQGTVSCEAICKHKMAIVWNWDKNAKLLYMIVWSNEAILCVLVL